MLQLLFSDTARAPVALTGSRIRLGRRSDNDVVVGDPSVAERHAALTVEQGKTVVVEPEAGAETFVNDEPVAGRRALNPGDRLRLGRVELRLAEARGPAATVARPPAAEWSLVAMDTGKAWPVARSIIVGRQPDCGLPIPDERISRNHARLRLQDGTLVIEDLGSTNGTFVNGERIQTRTLEDGDVIEFDRRRFRVAGRSALASAPAGRPTVLAESPGEKERASAAPAARTDALPPAVEPPPREASAKQSERAPASAAAKPATGQAAAVDAAPPAVETRPPPAVPEKQREPVPANRSEAKPDSGPAARVEASAVAAVPPGAPDVSAKKSEPSPVSAPEANAAGAPEARSPAPAVALRKTKWWERPSMGPRRTTLMPGGAAREAAHERARVAPADLSGPVLVGLSQVVEKRRIELRPGSLLVGRSPTSDAVVDDSRVSDKHAQLLFENGSASVVSLPNCTNGTFVNGARAAGRVYLNPGDVVSFGGVEFQFWVPGRSQAARRLSWTYALLGFLAVAVAALALVVALR